MTIDPPTQECNPSPESQLAKRRERNEAHKALFGRNWEYPLAGGIAAAEKLVRRLDRHILVMKVQEAKRKSKAAKPAKVIKLYPPAGAPQAGQAAAAGQARRAFRAVPACRRRR
jgi:hypothetical protein